MDGGRDASLYRAVVDGLEQAVVLVDERGAVLDLNASAERLLPAEAIAEVAAWDLVDEDGDPLEPNEHPALRCLRTGIEEPRRTVGFVRGDGTVAWAQVDARPARANGTTVAVLSITDHTQARTEAARRRELAGRDTLTGLPNRRRFEEELRAQVAACRRDGASAVLLLIDLDNLRRINITLGHAAGDELLREAARRLVDRMRSDDTLARFGGDEFAVLLANADLPLGEQIAGRLAAALAAPEAADAPVPAASIGVCALDDRTSSAEAAITVALGAVREAQAHGGATTRSARAAGDSGVWRPARAAAEVLERLGAVADDLSVQRLVEAAREMLGMELAYITEITQDEQIFELVAGDGTSFGFEPGTRVAIADTFCAQVLAGAFPAVIPDVADFPDACGMPAATAARISAYISVPIRYADGRLHGTLCCIAHEPHPDLGDRDLQLMNLLARMIADQLERSQLIDERERLRAASAGMRALVAAVEARDQYTSEHSEIVLELVGATARGMGLPEADVEAAEQVAMLHDLGKLGVPDAILNKPGPLDEDEWEIMRGHPEAGAQIVAAIPELEHLAPAIRAEHERWDGAGYPAGLRGEEIPVAARIAFVCDAYSAMTSDRPYRAALTREAALAEIRTGAGSQFDPAAAAALIAELSR